MQKKKQLHYVQKEYLKNWCIDGNKLAWSDLETQRDYSNTTPESILKQNNLYYLELEEFFTQLEGDGIIIIRKLINETKITFGERHILSNYVAAQRIRTRFALETSGDISTSLLVNALKKAPDDKEKVKFYMEKYGIEIEGNSHSLQDILVRIQNGEIGIPIQKKKEVWNKQICEHIPLLSAKYFASEWHILRCGKDTSFITSDAPVSELAFTFGKSGLVDLKDCPIIEHMFPLNPKTILVIRMIGIKMNGERTINEYGTLENIGSVRDFNGRTVKYAMQYIVGINKEHLASLRGCYSNLWKVRTEIRTTSENVGRLSPTYEPDTSKSIRLRKYGNPKITIKY